MRQHEGYVRAHNGYVREHSDCVREHSDCIREHNDRVREQSDCVREHNDCIREHNDRVREPDGKKKPLPVARVVAISGVRPSIGCTADNNAKLATQTQTAMEEDWNLAFNEYCNVGENKTKGDPAKIVAIGLTVVGAASPAAPLSAPQNVLATMGDNAGEIELMCEPVEGAVMYLWEVCENPMVPANFRSIGMDTRSRLTATGLTSGTVYWFRVRAKGSADKIGPWSDPCQKMAP